MPNVHIRNWTCLKWKIIHIKQNFAECSHCAEDFCRLWKLLPNVNINRVLSPLRLGSPPSNLENPSKLILWKLMFQMISSKTKKNCFWCNFFSRKTSIFFLLFLEFWVRLHSRQDSVGKIHYFSLCLLVKYTFTTL